MWRDAKKAKGLKRKLFYIFGSPAKIAQQNLKNNKEKKVA